MANVKPAFKSKKAEKIYKRFVRMPALTDEEARKMVEAIERVTGRKHPLQTMPSNGLTKKNPA